MRGAEAGSASENTMGDKDEVMSVYIQNKQKP